MEALRFELSSKTHAITASRGLHGDNVRATKYDGPEYAGRLTLNVSIWQGDRSRARSSPILKVVFAHSATTGHHRGVDDNGFCLHLGSTKCQYRISLGSSSHPSPHPNPAAAPNVHDDQVTSTRREGCKETTSSKALEKRPHENATPPMKSRSPSLQLPDTCFNEHVPPATLKNSNETRSKDPYHPLIYVTATLFPLSTLPPSAAGRVLTSTTSKAPAKPDEAAKAGKKTSKPAAPGGDKKKSQKARKVTYSSYIYDDQSDPSISRFSLLRCRRLSVVKSIHHGTSISDKQLPFRLPQQEHRQPVESRWWSGLLLSLTRWEHRTWGNALNLQGGRPRLLAALAPAEGAKSAKKTSKRTTFSDGGKEWGKGRERRRTLKSLVHLPGPQAGRPDSGISNKAMTILNFFVNDVFDLISEGYPQLLRQRRLGAGRH
ncbi:hypothetical protein NMY22_g9305 [Coprinellus aureogranulatus]|nr:hypothetical protein NMY22_g9305 [Coprinellus aureogranulatus]